MKFKRESFEAQFTDGWAERKGYTSGKFAIHKAWDGWRTTHLPSGMLCSSSPFETLKKAKTYLEKIIPLHDWESDDPEYYSKELMQTLVDIRHEI